MALHPSIQNPAVDWNATPTEQLPRLPGKVGTPQSPPRIEYPLENTQIFDRVVFPPVAKDPPYAGWKRNELYTRARKLKIPGRSRMTKIQLKAAIILKEGL